MSKTEEPPQSTKAASQGLTWRALILAIGLTILCGMWVRQAEILVIATQITESVPAIPALAALFLLLGLNQLLRLVRRRWELSRVEMLTVYTFVGIASALAGVGVTRFFIATLTALWWYLPGNPDFGYLQRFLPGWAVPHNYDLLMGIYMGGGAVPWKVWMVPLLAWTGFFLTAWCAMLCLLVLLRKRWMHEERLSFPVVELALEMTDPTLGRGKGRPFFKNPVMWVGFGLTFLFNLLNILHALRPAIPGIPLNTPIGPTNASLPWSMVFPINVFFQPLMIGFGFLVSTEISFSIWFFFLVFKLEALLGGSLGYTTTGVPYAQEQGMGAFLLLGLGLLWASRGTFRQALLDWSPRARAPRDPNSPFGLRWALLGLVVASTLLLGFCVALGMEAWAAFMYLVILGLVALVCARIRAEAGIPSLWAFPNIANRVPIYLLGSAAFMGRSPSTLTSLALLTVFAFGFFPSVVGGYQVDSFRIAERTRMKPSHMAFIVVLACLVGLGVSFYFHLTPYYAKGAVNMRNGDIWGTWVAWGSFGQAAQATHAAIPPDGGRIGATAVGMVVAGLLSSLRALGGGPFHPLGFAVSASAGENLWFSFFIVWVLKTIILRYGGIRLYRAAIPAFLGFALGHLFTAGVVWGLLGAMFPDFVSGYAVWFG